MPKKKSKPEPLQVKEFAVLNYISFVTGEGDHTLYGYAVTCPYCNEQHVHNFERQMDAGESVEVESDCGGGIYRIAQPGV